LKIRQIIYIFIDVTILSSRNVIQKEAEKKLKYKYVTIEIQRTLNIKCFVIPVIIRATGLATKNLNNIWKLYWENI
jgi:hypothetical protein